MPTSLYHFETKDVKRIRTKSNVEAETRNLATLISKWKGSEFYRTLDMRVND